MALGKSRDSIRIPNLGIIRKQLIELGVSKQELSEASFKAGQITANAVRGLITPHSKSGRLMRTVKASKAMNKVRITMGNNTTVKYAGLQNFGSKRKNVDGQYFMQMGIRRTRQIVLDTYLNTLQKLINKAERKINNGQ